MFICFATYLSQHTTSNSILWKVHVCNPISLDLFNFLRVSTMLQITLTLVSKIFIFSCKTTLQKL